MIGDVPGLGARFVGAPPAAAQRRLATAVVDPLARAAAQAVVRRATGGKVRLVEDGRAPGGTTPRAATPCAATADATATDGRQVTVNVKNPAAYRAALFGGSVGLGRSYMAGWWESDDLVALLRLAIRALPAPGRPLDVVAGLVGRLRGERSGGTADDGGRCKDRSDVRAHYDLGDDFFSLFLDPTLTYSCGIFDPPTVSMEAASVEKLDRICRKLRLSRGDEVLEIGTGWGSFALHAAGRYGCRVTTTTISERQFATARRRVAEAGLAHLVTVRNDDYRDLSGTYDKLVSIEMIEAVGWRAQDRFMALCAERLRPTGAMALQAIVIDDRHYERAKRKEDFIKASVFPGSTIPSLRSITASVARTDLVVADREDLGSHYAETLARWRARFQENRDRIAALGFGPELLRAWDLYLAYCQAGFLEGRIGDVQLVLRKPGCGNAARAPGPEVATC
jgi:cyclopropane-fatty-acyl-phospholipid synthase